jgi:hypothetical protein
MRSPLVWLAASVLAVPVLTAADWTFRNPAAGEFRDELMRVPVAVPAGDFSMAMDGRPVPHQVDRSGPKPALWVRASFKPGESHSFGTRPGIPAASKPLVAVRRENGGIVLDNGVIAVRLPDGSDPAAPPLLGVKGEGQTAWIGKGTWKTSLKPAKLEAAVVGDGTLFGKVRLFYRFEGADPAVAATGAWAIVDVSLAPGKSHAEVEESHAMGRNDAWEFDCAAGWKPTRSLYKTHGSGAGQAHNEDLRVGTLLPGQTRLGDVLLRLMPRWTQAFDDGWFFAASDSRTVVGAIPARASRWFWPHDNLIDISLAKSGDRAALVLPTWKGTRWWMLVAGPEDRLATEPGGAKTSPVRSLLMSDVYASLDKIANDYITDWPGAKGTFQGLFPFDYGDINPTGHWRGLVKGALANAGKPGDIGSLTLAQVIMDPDIYGSYWLHWSPENPNFFSDFNARGIALVTTLKGHPRFKELAAIAEAKVREDLHHSVTLPGGAGQECPGYQSHGVGAIEGVAKVCKEHLGFDAFAWPYFAATRDFLFRISQPDGSIRRILPIGDTHPGKDGPNPIENYRATGNAAALKTEELPGFGAIFRNRPGTPRETYLAFKSGPNRGHYHGDQLAIHWCADATPLAVDHHASYKPRAGQEHMHNRVAFHTAELPYANMDGHERLIAFVPGADCDIAVGEVESTRLRITNEFPPEEWDVEFPQAAFPDHPLRYRRTVVAVKNAASGDYFVLRDQFDLPPKVRATWCLHVRSDAVKQNGPRIEFGKATVFCAAPAGFEFRSFPWSHENGRPESTQGARLTAPPDAREFITVLHPGANPPAMQAIEGGVKVGTDEIVFAGGIDDIDATAYATVRRGTQALATLTGKQIDMDRSQGKIGLFVPDAGYPFGDIPEWLIRQRANSVP